ncbi:hypothetical protein fugu_004709 [Takifugu bimaculatus]|uniref:VPS10 domain-containing protein n=1 Tax=Takifugu bimaculatus TaxID=433685 RepID=A0A4Z2B8P9_9TELE|nr:hypothetical protein fugu_004709 [Takifugu bimaculatus]
MTLASRMILSLGLLSSALGSALQREEKDARRLQTEFGNDEGPRTSEGSLLSKGSSGLNEKTCTAPPGLEATLREDTHSFMFKVKTMSSLSLAWVGDASGVLLVLTTFQVPLFMVHFAQSNLYRSKDHGKTFQDVTHLINHTFIHTDFGIAISPDHSGKVMLTGDVSETRGFRLFRSRDFGLTFDPVDLPFEPLIQMLYNPGDCNIILTLSVMLDLWLSEDFGATWRKIHDSVCLVRWGQKNSIYFTTNHNRSCNDRGSLELRKTADYGRSFQTIATRVYSFVLGGRFVFASIMTGTTTGEPSSPSLWNGHLYTTTGSETDFTAITSLRGVYMTSVLTEDGVVETVVTFDQGAKWQVLRSPQSSQCDSETSTNRPKRCRLHIHASYSTTMKMNVPMLPLSQPNAVGLVLAHGSVGDSESVLSPDVYVSDDGGYSWLLALKGPHHYAILDSGGLLVAVEHTNVPVNQIKFSTDEGQCWHAYNFTSDPFHFVSMDSEPGSRSMNVSLWGYRTGFTKWVVITVDFRKLFTQDCTDADYVQWLAHSTESTGPGDGCVLGYKETFLRLRKGSVCWNGRDYSVTKRLSPCPCTLDDYHCDFGYYRPENSSECVEQEEMKRRPLEFCLNGTVEQLRTSGYRKIPGDQCEGGFQPERKETALSRICISDFLRTDSLTPHHQSSPNTAVIVTVVIAILLMSAVMGVWLVKKYVCGGTVPRAQILCYEGTRGGEQNRRGR